MAKSLPDPFTAFAEAGRKCFIVPCKADTMYVVIGNDYIFPACGRHLTSALDALKSQEEPPILSMTIYVRP